MITKTVLGVPDLVGMLDAVYEYNRRGQVQGLAFFDDKGQAVSVAAIEVYSDEPGLAIRSAPEPAKDQLDRMLNPPVVDPRKVPMPATVSELNTIADQ